MSRATVRAGLRTWLSGQVAGINTVYPALPRVIPAAAFVAGQTGTGDGCVAVLTIVSEQERRGGLGGATSGGKWIDYVVVIQLFYRRTLPQTGQVGETNPDADMAIVAMGSFDALVETLKARIRADRTAGGAVWQWGEKALSGEYGDPYERGDAIEIWGALRVAVTEWIQS